MQLLWLLDHVPYQMARSEARNAVHSYFQSLYKHIMTHSPRATFIIVPSYRRSWHRIAGSWLQVAELRTLLSKYKLENGNDADIHGRSAPPETLKHMASLVETVNTLHSKVLRMEGNHASKFVSPSVDRCALCEF